MKAKTKTTTKNTTSDGYLYLTKRILVGRAQSAGKVAAKKAMEMMGHVVTVKDGWVVKLYQDGKVERIKELENNN